MFTVLPVFVLIVQVLTGTWTATGFAVGMTVWYGIIMAHPQWVQSHTQTVFQPINYSRVVILGLSNAFALWFAGLPTRMLHKAFGQLERTTNDLERRVEARTEDLARANRELEASNTGLDSFARSVSHDLRAPLRSILSYSQMVLDGEKSNLATESRAYLKYSVGAANRANDLIDAFLELARFSTKPLVKSTCDLSAMAVESVDSLRRQFPERSVDFHCPNTAIVFGDPSLMRSVVVNLVSNAWKYTGKTTSPRIEFLVEEEPAGSVFLVRDNGAGFDMTHAGRLFQHFSRLHPNSEFEGTGIGLSNVQRTG